jgi:hypothetical protein
MIAVICKLTPLEIKISNGVRGQNLRLHPHLQCIVPRGGVSEAGIWKKGTAKDDFLFSLKLMSNEFRGHFMSKLRKAFPNYQNIYMITCSKKSDLFMPNLLLETGTRD